MGSAGPGGEVVHLVVQQHAGPFGRHVAAEPAIERVGVGNGVAFGIDDREMGGLGRFETGGLAGSDRGRRLPSQNLLPQPGRIRFARQPFYRHWNEIGVTQERGAVGIGAPHGFRDEPHGMKGIGLAQVERLEHIEHFDQADAAGTRRRHGQNLVPAEGGANRWPKLRLVLAQVVGGNEASVFAHRGRDGLGDGPAIESFRASRRDATERLREIRLAENFTRLV